MEEGGGGGGWRGLSHKAAREKLSTVANQYDSSHMHKEAEASTPCLLKGGGAVWVMGGKCGCAGIRQCECGTILIQ